MKTILILLAAVLIAASGYSQETPVTPPLKLDIQRFFKSQKFKIAPSINIVPTIGKHSDVAMIDMPKPVLLFENTMGKVYEQPADKMKYLAPINNSKMPVKK